MTIPPNKLYKYLPSQYIKNLLKGELLFRNLSYFRQSECNQRGDLLEGHHRDNPDNDITLMNLTRRTKTVGDFSFLSTTDSDHIFVFCLSNVYNHQLLNEFKSDACVEIFNTKEFIRRVQFKLKRLISLHKYGLLHGDAKYYKPNARAEFDINDPRELVFAKDVFFHHQVEYRLAFGNKKAFKLIKKIIDNVLYNFDTEAMKGTPKEKIINIGNISDIARLIT